MPEDIKISLPEKLVEILDSYNCDIATWEQAKFIIKEKDNRITMYVDGKEIGPRFEIEWSSE